MEVVESQHIYCYLTNTASRSNSIDLNLGWGINESCLDNLNISQNQKEEPIRYDSKTNWRGAAFVSTGKIDVWRGNEESGRKLVGRMSNLYEELTRMTAPDGTAKV